MSPKTKFSRLGIVISIIFLASFTFAMLVRSLTPPPPQANWLTRKGESTLAIAEAYYDTINAPLTLNEWLTLYGFGSDEVQAVYYNAADLGFGRDMHCRGEEDDDFIACIVGNYGLGPAGPTHIALKNAIAQEDILASVAMVYEKIDPGTNRVKFYIYDAQGMLIPAVPLDSEGEKYLPHMCLACHGGDATVLPMAPADPTTVEVDGANFLPFDPFSFKYSEQAGFTQADQEESLRALNALVVSTTPTMSITELINGLYPGGVTNPGSTADASYIPDEWNADEEMYQNVITPYCRTCHVAHFYWPPDRAILSESAVFTSSIMPHAELTFNNFWRYGDPGTPAFLAREADWSTVVNSTNDATGDCVGGSCSLRSAINIANGSGGENIITFDPATTDGNPIMLTGGNGGDLNVMRQDARILILGNGADVTIIDGGSIDRVFQIDPGANVYMQALTIRGGLTNGLGGGIYNQGTLTLNDVIIEDNVAGSGGGLANAGQMSLDDSAVIRNTAVTGAGIANTAVFTMTTSTLSANDGPGLYNSGTMTMTYSTVTENSAGGLFNDGGSSTIGTSALANNNGNPDCSGTIASSGYNLVQATTGCNLTGGTATNIIGVPALLGPLETPTGGSTPSHIPLPGSPLLDAVPFETNPLLFVSLADQHGTPRPQLLLNDIGAVERVTLEIIFLPLLTNNYVSAPDLVITSLTATADAFTLVIENQGNSAVVDPFWVDLYINPAPPPTMVNQIWSDLGDEGLVWGVTDSIAPGAALTLTYTTDPSDTHPYFFPSESNYNGVLALGTSVYAQVDSVNLATNTGGVLETHEIMGTANNNIISTTATAFHTALSILPNAVHISSIPQNVLLPLR